LGFVIIVIDIIMGMTTHTYMQEWKLGDYLLKILELYILDKLMPKRILFV